MKKSISLFVFILICGMVSAQSVLGTWKTIDDETGEAKSYLTLYEKNDKVYGKVAKLLKSAPDKLCEKCPGSRHNQPILGMVVLIDMEKKDGYYQKGKILDPEKGKWYTCNFWLQKGNSDVLEVRGYIGPFFRTQKWYRVDEESSN
jgi:uncharacterized protein (DUF2147 family)